MCIRDRSYWASPAICNYTDQHSVTCHLTLNAVLHLGSYKCGYLVKTSLGCCNYSTFSVSHTSFLLVDQQKMTVICHWLYFCCPYYLRLAYMGWDVTALYTLLSFFQSSKRLTLFHYGSLQIQLLVVKSVTQVWVFCLAGNTTSDWLCDRWVMYRRQHV